MYSRMSVSLIRDDVYKLQVESRIHILLHSSSNFVLTLIWALLNCPAHLYRSVRCWRRKQGHILSFRISSNSKWKTLSHQRRVQGQSKRRIFRTCEYLPVQVEFPSRSHRIIKKENPVCIHNYELARENIEVEVNSCQPAVGWL